MTAETWLKPPQSSLLKSGRVILQPGEEVGRHVTTKKEEVIIVLRGSATVHAGEETITLHPGATHFIPEGVNHNVVNTGKDVLEYLYVVGLLP
jgi:mannose-1-phosphate guanylyltransferase